MFITPLWKEEVMVFFFSNKFRRGVIGNDVEEVDRK